MVNINGIVSKTQTFVNTTLPIYFTAPVLNTSALGPFFICALFHGKDLKCFELFKLKCLYLEFVKI